MRCRRGNRTRRKMGDDTACRRYKSSISSFRTACCKRCLVGFWTPPSHVSTKEHTTVGCQLRSRHSTTHTALLQRTSLFRLYFCRSSDSALIELCCSCKCAATVSVGQRLANTKHNNLIGKKGGLLPAHSVPPHVIAC